MKLRFPESKLRAWAEAFPDQGEDAVLRGMAEAIRDAGRLSKAQLRAVARWKSPRSAPHIEGNSEAFVEEVTGFALAAGEERSRIEALTLLDGVSWPTASVILHFFHPEPYPVLDVRALWSVGLAQPGQYTFPFWWAYLRYCRALAARAQVDMRMLDRALWQYAKERQPALGS
ncbi:MAG TPA: hypothetical protein VJ570_09660 [Holophagaceae bacterium]|nr:hypothetical protein [Holophagaceae bacterium]